MKGYNISQLSVMLKQTSKQTRKILDDKGIQPLQEITVGKRTFAAYGEDAVVYIMSLRAMVDDRKAKEAERVSAKTAAKATPVLPQDAVAIIDALALIEQRMAALEAKVDELLVIANRISEDSWLTDEHVEVA